jgi:acyl carrier protein
MGMDLVELVMEIEDDFQVSIPDEEAQLIRTVGELSEWLAREVSADSTPSSWTTDQLQAHLYQIIADQLGIRVEDIHPESRFVEDLGAD